MESHSLEKLIDKAHVECLNEDPSYPVGNALFQPNDGLLLKSLDDEQLLIKIAFIEPVKVSHLALKRGNASASDAPTTVKLFTGSSHMGFSDASTNPPVQSLEFSESDVKEGRRVALRFVKFQNIRELCIFIEENNGGEVSALSRVELFGHSGEKMDMKDWKPVEKDKLMHREE